MITFTIKRDKDGEKHEITAEPREDWLKGFDVAKHATANIVVQLQNHLRSNWAKLFKALEGDKLREAVAVEAARWLNEGGQVSTQKVVTLDKAHATDDVVAALEGQGVRVIIR